MLLELRDTEAAQADASVTGLPLASLQAPDAQTAGSVTGLPEASVHVAVLEGAEVADGLLARTGEALSVSAANAVPQTVSERTAANADRVSNPCIIVCPNRGLIPRD